MHHKSLVNGPTASDCGAMPTVMASLRSIRSSLAASTRPFGIAFYPVGPEPKFVVVGLVLKIGSVLLLGPN